MPKRRVNLNGKVFLKSFRAVHRLFLCLGLALAVFSILYLFELELSLCIIISWNSFSLFTIAISWITFFTTNSKELSIKAREQDESRSATFVIILVSVCISLFGTLALIQSTNESTMSQSLHVVFSMVSVALSWFLLHTIYTLRYAHLYYSQSLSSAKVHPSGFDFPESKSPDYLDFAYLSFVIGMTFQVSDVRVTSSTIRRFVLLHGLISFMFNTIIVALTINTIAGLSN